MSTRAARSPKTVRRGMKIDSRPGYVTVIARATEGGSLEVKEEEYAEYERAEQTKNDENAPPEAKAMASILSRKLLNKWRERWVTKNPLYAEEGDAAHHGGVFMNGDYDGGTGKSPTLSNPTSSSLRRRSSDYGDESEDVDLGESGRSSSTIHYRNRNDSNGGPRKRPRQLIITIPPSPPPTPAAISTPEVMSKLAALEMGQARLESTLHSIQATQGNLEAGMNRILAIFQLQQSQQAQLTASPHSSPQPQAYQQYTSPPTPSMHQQQLQHQQQLHQEHLIQQQQMYGREGLLRFASASQARQ